MIRTIRTIGVVIASLAALALAGPGASAAVPGPAAAGEISGLMSIAPGISGFGPAAQSWAFGSVIVAGVFASDDGSQQYAGAFGIDDLTLTGTGGGDLPDERGTVNPFGWDTNEGFPGVGSLRNGSCAGTYTRTLTVLQLTLECGVGINVAEGSSAQNFHSTISVVGTLVPVTGDGVLNPITQAAFTGVLHS